MTRKEEFLLVVQTAVIVKSIQENEDWEIAKSAITTAIDEIIEEAIPGNIDIAASKFIDWYFDQQSAEPSKIPKPEFIR